MEKPIKVILLSNHSRMVTGFGKNMKNILMRLHQDPRFEVIEAANGTYFGSDLKTPWKSYGTMPRDPSVLAKIQADPAREQAASYGLYCIDEIIEKEKPDVFLGIEDIWAFREFEKKPWWNSIPKIIWTTIDSVPLLPECKTLYDNVDKFLVWASFAEEEMKKLGCENVETLHGAIDLSNFKPLSNRAEIRAKHGITDEFVIGFVFKNQLRKSVPNLLEGFRLFKERSGIKAKLLLHTDWSETQRGWDICRFLDEKKIDKNDVLATYVCHSCHSYGVHPYVGEGQDCRVCGNSKCVHTKTSGFGVSEEQLNEIYNAMDVYCHPFTSGGQELPIQEAKAAGLVTLVTSYSCGTDSCYPEQGGLPLEWEEYREPSTQFIKATTKAESVFSNLRRIHSISNGSDDKRKLLENGRKCLKEKFDLDKIASRLKEIIIEAKANFVPKISEALPAPSQQTFDDFLDKDDEGRRLAVVIPQSEEDVFLVNSLLTNIKEVYQDYNIYFITKPEYFELIEDHPAVYRMIPYQDGIDNLHLLEGKGDHKGYFEIAFLPHITTQKHFGYHHNGKDKIQFKL
jgi:glycosyltransferase involved in cell wall biosynthesis